MTVVEHYVYVQQHSEAPTLLSAEPATLQGAVDAGRGWLADNGRFHGDGARSRFYVVRWTAGATMMTYVGCEDEWRRWRRDGRVMAF